MERLIIFLVAFMSVGEVSVQATNHRLDVVLPSEGEENLVAPPPAIGDFPNVDGMVELEALPNPAQHSTEFKYRLPEGTEAAQVVVTDLAGRTVAVLEAVGSPGGIAWDTRAVPEGMYQYSLVVDKKTLATKRLAVAR